MNVKTGVLGLVLLSGVANAGEAGLTWTPVQHPHLTGYVAAWYVNGYQGQLATDPSTWVSVHLAAPLHAIWFPKVPCLQFEVTFAVAAEGVVEVNSTAVTRSPWTKITGFPTVERVIGQGRKDCRCRGLKALTCVNGVPRASITPNAIYAMFERDADYLPGINTIERTDITPCP